MRRLHRAVLADIELEYEITGTGEHVVLIHHGVGTDWFAPLCDEAILKDRYHRQGTRAAVRLTGELTFSREADTFRALMRHLGVPCAHIVGHSASGCLSLQIALDAPEVIHSVVLLEPALNGRS